MDKMDLMENYLSLLIEVVGLGFHIDTPASEYRTRKGKKLFTKEEAERIDHTLNEITVEMEDPYELGLEIFRRKKLINL